MNGDPLGKKLLRYIEKDESQTIWNQCAEKVSLPADCWWWGKGGGQDSYGTTLVSLSVALPRLPPKGYMRLLVLMVDDEMCLFLNAAQRQTSGLTACADPFTQVCNAAERTGRRSPRTATSRGRPPQRRNDHDPRTPRKGRLRPGKLQLHPIRCSFHLLPTLVYRKAHLCGIPMPLSPSRRLPSTATPRGRPPRRRNVTTPACRGRVASGQGSFVARGPEVLAALRGTRCSAFAESSRSCGTTRHHTDAACTP